MARKAGGKYDRIIEAAIKVIGENGFYNSQIARIAKEAGVADGTIYIYFQSKEDVLISIFQKKMGEFNQDVENALRQISHPEGKLSVLINLHFDYLENDPNLAALTLVELRQPNPLVQAGLQQPLQRYFRIIEGIVEDGKKLGVFSREFPTSLARKMIFGTIDEIATRWVVHRQKGSLQSLKAPVFHLLLNALCNQNHSF